MNPNAVNHRPDPSQPATFQRRVLLAVSGLTPQILTETLYALAADEDAPFVPTEVHLITSAEGARRAELSLLSDDLGWFHKLCADYHLPGVRFDRGHIHVMRDAHGQPMNDIRTPQDNQAAADFITAQVRAITADAGCALHASIAGGRKTMGFYLGYAVMGLGGTEHLNYSGQQAFSSGAHVNRTRRQPQCVNANHRSQSRSQAAHSPEHCSGQPTVTLEPPRRNSMRISAEVVATAACGSCTGKNSAPGLVHNAARLPPPPSRVRPSWLNQR